MKEMTRYSGEYNKSSTRWKTWALMKYNEVGQSHSCSSASQNCNLKIQMDNYHHLVVYRAGTVWSQELSHTKQTRWLHTNILLSLLLVSARIVFLESICKIYIYNDSLSNGKMKNFKESHEGM